MYLDYGPEVDAEIARREREGLPTLRWFRCHTCGAEAEVCGLRVMQCAHCSRFDTLHLHSDLDGEQPTRLGEA